MHHYFLKEATFHKHWRNFDNKGWNFLYQKLHNLSHISIERDISSIWNFLKWIIYFWLLCCIKIFLGNTYSLNCALGISYRQIRLHNYRTAPNKVWNFLYQKLHNLSHISIERDISSIWNFLKWIIYFWLLCCIKIFLGITYSLNCALGISYRQWRCISCTQFQMDEISRSILM